MTSENSVWDPLGVFAFILGYQENYIAGLECQGEGVIVTRTIDTVACNLIVYSPLSLFVNLCHPGFYFTCISHVFHM